MTKVLVTDCESRKALCVVRSLGKQGFNVYGGSEHRINMSKYSKYCSNFIRLSNPLTDENLYLQELIRTIKEHKIEVLIPMEDETVELIIRNKHLFNSVKTLLPDYNSFMIARDKAETIRSANQSGVPCPHTYFVKNIQELEDIKGLINYPVIIKPRISSGSRGIVHVYHKDEIIEKYKTIHRDYPSPIIQQYISGDYTKVQVLLITDENSELKGLCTYQGIREFPVDGGPVTLWKTISLPEIEKKTVRYIESINWIGFAEIEYILNERTGEYHLMEINPRFSANIALAVDVGIDFPLKFVKLALEEHVVLKVNKEFDRFCQWILPGDLLNFVFNKNRFNQDIGYFFNKPKGLTYAVLSKEDPLPSIATILSILINLFSNINNLRAKLKSSKR